jgi:hypothetical protein
MSPPLCEATTNSPTWGFIDFLQWKAVPEILGGRKLFIRRFKDGWVKHNRFFIKTFADSYNIPPELLAGVAWIEVGGDPTFIDRLAYEVRSFDWSGPKWVDENLTMTKNPNETSFGAVSMQLQTAARTMGINLESLSADDRIKLVTCLQRDIFNIQIVAKHLRDLALYDFLGIDTRKLTPDQIKVIGARYNRGAVLSLETIKKDLSYGEFILKMWQHLTKLLSEH